MAYDTGVLKILMHFWKLEIKKIDHWNISSKNVKLVIFKIHTWTFDQFTAKKKVVEKMSCSSNLIKSSNYNENMYN